MQGRFNNVVKGEKQKGRLTKFSTAQDGIVGEVTYEDGTKKELTQEEYDALEKQEGLFDVETGTQPVAETPVEETVSAPTEVAEEAAPIELKEGEIDITTVFKNPVEKNNEQAVAASNEFKDKAGEYDEGVNDPKFKEENTTVEEISVDDIVPTQERLFEENLKSPSEGEPLVMKVGDKYYVEDGHHRIGNGINADNQTVTVRIYESDKAKQETVPTKTQPTPKEPAPREDQPEFGPNEFGEAQDNIAREITDKTGEKFDLIPYDSTGPKSKISDTEDNSITLSVEDKNGNQVGFVSFNKGKDGKYKANNINLQDEYKRRGIGTEIYSYVESLGVELRPSMDQTQEGKSFWESRKKTKQDAIQEQAAGEVPVQPEAKAGEKVEEGTPKAEPKKPTQKGKEEVSEEEKVKAAKDNLNSVWEKWKQSQKNLGVVFDPKSKANEDMELLEAFVSYIQAIGAKTAKDIQKAFNDFTGGEATLDDAGADFVSESVKEPVTKKTDKELSREVTFTNIYDIIEKVEKRTPKKANPKEVNKRAYQNAYEYLLTSDWFASATDT
jgi:hypothetical protein